MKASLRLAIWALAAATSLVAAPWALAQHFDEWSDPVNLGPAVNSTFFEVTSTRRRVPEAAVQTDAAWRCAVPAARPRADAPRR